MKNITSKDWLDHELLSPLFLCQLPYCVAEIEARYHLEFIEAEEEGLGKVFYSFINIDSKQLCIKGFIDKTFKDEPVAVFMHSTEENPQALLSRFVEALKLNKEELVEIGEFLELPKFQLTRLDDNNNEVEIAKFHQKEAAEYVRQRFEDRGHKQDYYVNQL